MKTQTFYAICFENHDGSKTIGRTWCRKSNARKRAKYTAPAHKACHVMKYSHIPTGGFRQECIETIETYEME